MHVSTCNKRTIGIGVRPTSQIWFHNNSPFARKALFYIDRIGDYQCNKDYTVEREGYGFNFYMMFLVTSGTLHFQQESHCFLAPQGSVVLLNRRKRHKYWAEDDVNFKWLHFNGNSSKAYYDLLSSYESMPFFPSNFNSLIDDFIHLTDTINIQPVNEHQLSITIHAMLANLIKSCQAHFTSTEQLLKNSAKYIESHYNEKLRIDDLSHACNLSTFYYIRAFKRIYDFTPHGYIINIRVAIAKKLLLTTNLTIEEISTTIGFATSSNFIKLFKNNFGYTPNKFRKASP